MSAHFHCQDFENGMADLNYMFVHNFELRWSALYREGCTSWSEREQKKWEDVRSDIEGSTYTIY